VRTYFVGESAHSRNDHLLAPMRGEVAAAFSEALADPTSHRARTPAEMAAIACVYAARLSLTIHGNKHNPAQYLLHWYYVYKHPRILWDVMRWYRSRSGPTNIHWPEPGA
jgi:hypothetical protein